MIDEREEKSFENDLNSLNATVRRNAAAELRELCNTRKVRLNEDLEIHNLHCHTFFSYNGFGFSPSRIAWLAKKSGWFAVGMVDFDVLDGVDEFLETAQWFNLRAIAGMETRVFIPEFADKEINSPGEPGVAYHMGVGFASSQVPAAVRGFALELKNKASERTRRIVELVNAYMPEIALDFVRDAGGLTPKGNVTERHVCEAYRRKAETVYSDRDERARYLAGKLGMSCEDTLAILGNPAKLEAAIRAKTMKKGGAGYIVADPESFPTLAAMNQFVLACGAIPSIAWLNGLSAGEADVDALLAHHVANGVAMVNIVPDRNWNVSDPAKAAQLTAELDRIIAAAEALHLPVCVGTEMNAPGLKLVDSFEVPALSKHLQTFVTGAAIAAAHTLLTPFGKGYVSDWAKQEFADAAAKNAWFAEFGRRVRPLDFAALKTTLKEHPAEIMAALRK